MSEGTVIQNAGNAESSERLTRRPWSAKASVSAVFPTFRRSHLKLHLKKFGKQQKRTGKVVGPVVTERSGVPTVNTARVNSDVVKGHGQDVSQEVTGQMRKLKSFQNLRYRPHGSEVIHGGLMRIYTDCVYPKPSQTSGRCSKLPCINQGNFCRVLYSFAYSVSSPKSMKSSLRYSRLLPRL